MDYSDQFVFVINCQSWLMFFFLSLSLSQDGASCGGHSSCGSTSSLSTPPSVSQSPPQLNGIAAVGTASARLGGVAGLMGALGAGGMAGIVGALNGVIQTPTGTASPHTHNTGAAAGVTLPHNGYVGWLLLASRNLLEIKHALIKKVLKAE